MMLTNAIAKKNKTNDFIFSILLLITVIVLIVPFSPNMPVEELDSSWQFGLNQALAQGLAFGKNIIFTFGPYAAICTRLFHPQVDKLILLSSFYLGISFWLALLLNFKQCAWYIKFFLLLTLAALIHTIDGILFYYPLLVGIYIYKKTTLKPEDSSVVNRGLITLLFLPFGLLALTKGSILICCIAISILSIILLSLQRDFKSLTIVCLVPLLSTCLFWVLAKQPIEALPSYFTSILPIISGYTDAMSRRGRLFELFFYIITMALLLRTIFYGLNENLIKKIIVLLMFAIVLFLALKAGFVRHDAHALIAQTIIILSALLIFSLVTNKSAYISFVIVVIFWINVNAHYLSASYQYIINNFISTYLDAWDGLKSRIVDSKKLERLFAERLASMKAKAAFPILSGTTDIYSYDQAYLIASQNTWNPRPVFQSYSAYTPELIEKNKNHLSSKNRPDNIIFNIQPIDNRIPSLEDGASWPSLLVNYQPTEIKNGFIFLKARQKNMAITENSIIKRKYLFGENVNIPEIRGPIFAKINIKKSFIGNLMSLIFKPSILIINMTTKDGHVYHYRIVPGMAKTGFLISPLIENTDDFGALYTDLSSLEPRNIKTISINAKNGKVYWQRQFEVEFFFYKVDGAHLPDR